MSLRKLLPIPKALHKEKIRNSFPYTSTNNTTYTIAFDNAFATTDSTVTTSSFTITYDTSGNYCADSTGLV